MGRHRESAGGHSQGGPGRAGHRPVRRFGDEVEPYDFRAARAYGRCVATRRRIGRPIGYADAQIAAICLVSDCPVATRNVEDFTDLGITIINPWEPDTDRTIA